MLLATTLVTALIAGQFPNTEARTGATLSVTQQDAEIERFGKAISGSWRTEGLDPSTGERGVFWMHVAPATLAGADDVFYVEQSREGHLDEPWRQSFFQVYRNRGNIRVRTLTPTSKQLLGMMVGAWAAPELMPLMSLDDTVATLDVEFAARGDGFAGKTPHAYPSALAGAVEMTSQMSVAGDRMTTSDIGFSADGSEAWKTDYTWQRADPGVVVDRRENGLVTIDFARTTGEGAVDGDIAFVHYTLWLTDGQMIESSKTRGTLYRVTFPFPGIEGWKQGIAGIAEGARRKIVIPSALGYAEMQAGPIPPNSTLIFMIEVHKLEKNKPDSTVKPEGPAATDPTGG